MQSLITLAGILVAVVLALDGLLHAFWATGQVWPAHDRLSLAQTVLNTNNERSFRTAVLVPLVCMLGLGTLLILARIHQLGSLGQLVPAWLLQISVLIIGAGLLLRGIAGLAWAFGLAPSRSKLFYKLNLVLYTPLCLLLFCAVALIAFS
ncbi:DUF3995 domain-containing protein [Ktedonosporobacter rubrisoli]|uniref:DUF3995 domain-containing protein n=1 Tax=Ktedonosporobacter rubrisoli TaxID=2509675 RepID=A0A4P6JLB1_KTERU|nr:DUF3995 domain-containing protein [Ktedonosporobacter rubrisoli]QBD75782.1 DUF3995 domain-containing protein [Ktedonosporobacter rubrisoli]